MLYSVPLSECTTIHSSIDGHLGGFQCFLTTNYTAVNFFIPISIDICMKASRNQIFAILPWSLLEMQHPRPPTSDLLN